MHFKVFAMPRETVSLTDNNSKRRSSLLRQNILLSFVVKGWSAVVVFLMVPLTLSCLGEYKNGVWLTISSLMLWIDNMDIGLGNGLRNKLAAHLAHGDIPQARKLVSFLNVSQDKIGSLDMVLMVTVTFVCLTFIFKLIGNFYMGLQQPAVSNLLICLGQTLALVGTYILYKSGSHSLFHIALVNTAAPFAVYLLAYPVTFVFSLMLVVFTVICMPFWNATTDAYERGDMDWIGRATRKLNVMTIAIFAGMVLMVALSDWVYDVWIGEGTHIELRLSIVMAVYIFILIYSMRYSYFINGIGKLWLQLLFTTSAAILFIPLAYAAAHLTHDIIWFVAMMCLVNIPGLIANRIQFAKLISGKATGIWNK